MKYIIILLVFFMLLTGCIWYDDPHFEKKLVKDFWLSWQGDDSNQLILLSNNGYDGIVEIRSTVFSVGYDNDFIIAKQHPDKESEISESLFSKKNSKGDFVIQNVTDTIYLDKDDSIYEDNGIWYHTSNGWNPPDSLKPYKEITYFYIIDIRNYKSDNHNSYKLYKFNNQNNFDSAREKLRVPSNLVFTLTDKNIQ